MFSFFFLGLHLWHMEVPRPRVESELQLPAYTTATATTAQYLGRVCHLHHSSRLRRIPDPWVRPGIEPASSRILVRCVSAGPQWELPNTLIFSMEIIRRERYLEYFIFLWYFSLILFSLDQRWNYHRSICLWFILSGPKVELS